MKLLNYKAQFRSYKMLKVLSILFVMVFSFGKVATAQEKKQMVRLAKIKVDPVQLKNYTTALNEQMNTAIRVEPGVLTYYAVADKSNPSNITILEIYADTATYKAHIETAHFKKYKETVKDMVKSLKLVDVTLLNSAKKPGM
ncbi:putative quinol monooxygenase [Cytophagaceae bacterium DM2B3-1]|uniref:Quinol monooxygenase n=1 Tax=Xanthocytophaga flava TaxID=3048013 RepID=A0ABT7CPA4_9BACT|nr:putative quinol monooxygenase [Xanthocytophaga flavus]MDJ1494825.1 putative quinol monooxygenase [Xanthocytophaga flavus]